TAERALYLIGGREVQLEHAVESGLLVLLRHGEAHHHLLHAGIDHRLALDLGVDLRRCVLKLRRRQLLLAYVGEDHLELADRFVSRAAFFEQHPLLGDDADRVLADVLVVRRARLDDRRVIERGDAVIERLARQDVAVRDHRREQLAGGLAQLAIALEPLLAEFRRQLVAALHHPDDPEHWTNSITATPPALLRSYPGSRARCLRCLALVFVSEPPTPRLNTR